MNPFSFLISRSPQRSDTTYIYQLFVEPDPAHPVPTVQHLMERSFFGSQILLAKVSMLKAL